MLSKIIIVACLLIISYAQQSPNSPCPRIFHYETDGVQWYGIIKLPSPPFGSVLKLNLKMSIRTKLPTKYAGRIEMLGERSDILQQLLKRGTLKYKVHFPLLTIIPRITSVIFNNQVFCTGPPAGGNVVTSINLHHTLYSGGNKGAKINTRVTYKPNVNDDQPAYTSLSEYDEYKDDDAPLNNVNLRPTSDSKIFVADAEKPNPENFARPLKTGEIIRPTSQNRNPFLQPKKEVTPKYQTYRETEIVCGIPKKTSTALIVGGDATSRGDWPWLTALFVKKISGLEFICAGSLVSSKHIVTAAHCVFQKNNRPVKVHELIIKLGCFNLQDWTDEMTKTVSVEDIKLHPNFDGGLVLKDDIAILVTKPVEFTDVIIPVCLWEGNEDLNLVVGKKGIVIGWGRDENGLVATPEPRQASVPIVSTETCRASRPEFFVLTSEFTLCGGGRDGTGPCNGDSGGGLYLSINGRWVLRGIVSNSLKDPTSTNSCNLNEYVVFTDAGKYARWIKELIRNS